MVEKESGVKRFRSTLVFTALVFGALFWAFWDYDATESEKELKKEQSKLFSLDKSKVVEFSINTGDQRVVIKKAKDLWRLSAPVDDLADKSSVDQYLNTLFDQTSEESIEEEGGIDEKIYGLHTPLGTIDLKQEDGQTQSLAIGSVKAFDGKHYVKRSTESKIYSASSIWSSQLEKSAKDFREKRVFEGSKSSVEKVEIVSPKGQLTLFKENDLWKMKGSDFKLDSNSITRFLDKIETLHASEFVSEDKENLSDLKKFLLHDPKKVSTIKIISSPKEGNAASSEWTLLFGPTTDSKVYFFVSNRKPIMQLAEATAQGFAVSADDFRDKKEPFRFHSDYDQKIVETIELKGSAGTITLKKDKDLWSVGVDDKEVNVNAVNDLFNKVKNLEVSKFDLPVKPKAPRKSDSSKEYRLVFRGGDGGETPLLDIHWGNSFKDSKSNKELYEVESNLFKDKIGVTLSSLDSLSRLELVKQKGSKKQPDDVTEDGGVEVDDDSSHEGDDHHDDDHGH